MNCSDHGNFGYDNNVCVEKLRQDPLVSFSSFPAEFVNVEEILGHQLFSGLHIDNDVSVEEIVSCTITTRVVLGNDNLTSFWKAQIKVSENFVLSSNLSVTFSSNSTQVHIVGDKKLILPTLQSLLFFPLLYFSGEISITAELYSMGLHSRSSHSVWMKPFNHKPFIVSSLQDPIVLTGDSQSAVPFTVFDHDIYFLVLSQSNIYLRAASQCCSLNLRLNKLSDAIIYVAPSNYVGAVAISVNCSDHDNFGNDNNVCVHDQSVEKICWYLSVLFLQNL